MSTAVIKFALKMQEELDNNAHKSGWDNLSAQWCINRIRQETMELENAIKHKKSVEQIQSECADIANFAMFISDNLSRGDSK